MSEVPSTVTDTVSSGLSSGDQLSISRLVGPASAEATNVYMQHEAAEPKHSFAPELVGPETSEPSLVF